MELFLDATYLIALVDSRDPWHDQAHGLLDRVEESHGRHIHTWVLAEAIASLGPRIGGTRIRRTYEAFRDDTILHFPTEEDLTASMDTVVRFDGTLSLSDAFAVRLLERESLDAIVSFDDDFDKTGVERIS